MGYRDGGIEIGGADIEGIGLRAGSKYVDGGLAGALEGDSRVKVGLDRTWCGDTGEAEDSPSFLLLFSGCPAAAAAASCKRRR